MKTREVSVVPGSTGLFSPRWSPDGRYLLAITYGSKKLVLYDFSSQQWADWVTDPNNVDFPTWSADGQYVIYNNINVNDPKCRRVRLGSHQPEDWFDLGGLARYYGGNFGSWSGMAPDGSRLFVRDTSSQEIYALDVELPLIDSGRLPAVATIAETGHPKNLGHDCGHLRRRVSSRVRPARFSCRLRISRPAP